MNFNNTEWYRTGRVNIKNGALIVKGVSTSWLLAEIKAGDMFTIDGSSFYEIASVTSSTELNLKTQFQGETCEGQSYAIIPRVHAVMQAEIAARLETLLAEWENAGITPEDLYRSIDIVIPINAWKSSFDGASEYAYCADLQSDLITSSMTPIVSVYPASMQAAQAAGLCSFAMTLDKTLRFYSHSIPTGDISASALLLGSLNDSSEQPAYIPIASETTAGVIKAGRGLNIESDGTANVDVDDEVVGTEMEKLTASNTQVSSMLDRVFGN